MSNILCDQSITGDLAVSDNLTVGSSGDAITLSGTTNGLRLQHQAGFGAKILSYATNGPLTLDGSQDIVLDAAGGQVYMSQAGTTRFTFNVDSTPEIDVTGDFTIDGTGDITLDANDHLFLKADSGVQYIKLNDSGTTGGAATSFSIKTNHLDNVKAVFGTGNSTDGDAHIQFDGQNGNWEMSQNNSTAQFNIKNVGQGNIALDTSYGDITFGNGSGTIIARMDRSASSFQIDSGSLILSGTGRIQGIDTVSASTDAASKAYVDAQVGGSTVQTFHHGGFYHSSSSSSSTIYWLPTNYIIENTSSQYYNTWVAPHDGQVKKIIMRWASGTTPTATSVTFRYALNGSTSGTTFTPATNGTGTTSMKTTMTFNDDSIAFNEGDKFKLGFTTNGGTRLLYGFTYTIQLEYET